MRSAVTLCRVAEAAAGPFVFHDELESGFRKAAELGFDAVELFLPGPDAVPIADIKALQDRHQLAIAAVGTGAGMVKHGLSLTDPDPARRAAALEFIGSMIDFGGALGAPAILGSMQGRHGGMVSRDQAIGWLAGALQKTGDRAAAFSVPFIYEPLNRYETNLFNHAASAVDFLRQGDIGNVVLLADLFHMAIEERDIAASLLAMGDLLGHVHWADSNRQAMGFGHTPTGPIAAVLREMNYRGHLSAEVLPLPSPDEAARQTIASIHQHFPAETA
ncbi:sugar phosphate isomerase/epimerase family protein [Luteolibacter marinus]|uniref:sugar phosphate isomerase/epimerase family protein n=1 Tax=Luteolibacter marinus TaxID=2776705 RepID=UPI0018688127|nr:sugar phosphate isomerase/epimerase family protein [Luteolibacter marinus]